MESSFIFYFCHNCTWFLSWADVFWRQKWVDVASQSTLSHCRTCPSLSAGFWEGYGNMRHGGGQMTPRLTWVHTAWILPVHYPPRPLSRMSLLPDPCENMAAPGRHRFLGLIWKHLRPHPPGVPCCHLSSPLSQWNRKQHGHLPPLRTPREIEVTKCPHWCRDPRHPAFQTGPKAGGSRPDTQRCSSVILSLTCLASLAPGQKRSWGLSTLILMS